MHTEVHSGQDRRNKRPTIRTRARTENNQRHKLTETHTTTDPRKGRDEREAQGGRVSETYIQRDNTK